MKLRNLPIAIVVSVLLATAAGAQENSPKVYCQPAVRNISVGLFATPFPPGTSYLGTFDLDVLALGENHPTVGIRLEIERRQRVVMSGDGAGSKTSDDLALISVRLSDHRYSPGVDIYFGYGLPNDKRLIMGGMDFHIFKIESVVSFFGRFSLSGYWNDINRFRPDLGIGIGVSVGYHK